MSEKPINWRFVLLRYGAIFCATLYVVWNLAFILQGKIPPSMLTGLTGLPSPTTGGTRSISHLLHGDLQESLRANLFAFPISACFSVTLLLLGAQLLHHKPLSLPRWLVGTWGILLLSAWIFKLTGDPTYW